MTTNPCHEQFVRLLAANQGRIYAYIMTLVFDWSDTEELFQDTCVVLWQKFQDFEQGTDFARWACRVAHLNVLKWREKQARRREICSDKFLRSVAETQSELAEEFDERRRALAHCVQRLGEKDRELLRLRYMGNQSAVQVAEKVNRPAGSVYKSLHRIRRALYSCIQFRLNAEEGA